VFGIDDAGPSSLSCYRNSAAVQCRRMYSACRIRVWLQVSCVEAWERKPCAVSGDGLEMKLSRNRYRMGVCCCVKDSWNIEDGHGHPVVSTRSSHAHPWVRVDVEDSMAVGRSELASAKEQGVESRNLVEASKHTQLLAKCLVNARPNPFKTLERTKSLC
jgi:hypothetical protein